ncbi:MAG TPA: LysR family transcriptional regulator [Bradyrhizobium sp.]|nr:LysR family transcriptional regulator [Bradyrhizobium sp.]
MDQFAALATFVRVVDAGSLSGAARATASSLTSVSRQLSALERHFATRLVKRTTRRLALTEDGRILYGRAKAILAELGEIERALSAGHAEPTGRLRLSAPSLIGRLLVAPILPQFLQRHPALSIDLMLADRPVDMIEEDIHLALRIGQLPDSHLVARKLADIQMIVCAAPAYLERRGRPRTPEQLDEHDCLLFSDTPGAGSWRFRTENGAECKIPISAKLWINGLDALVAAARDGAGIVRVPSWQVRADLAAGRLTRILTSHEPAPAPLHLLFEATRLAAPKTRIFADYLISQWRASDPFGDRGLASAKE